MRSIAGFIRGCPAGGVDVMGTVGTGTVLYTGPAGPGAATAVGRVDPHRGRRPSDSAPWEVLPRRGEKQFGAADSARRGGRNTRLLTPAGVAREYGVRAVGGFVPPP